MATLRAEIYQRAPTGSAIAGTTVALSSSASTPWAAGPPLWTVGFYAVLTAVGGPAYVAIGDTPDPTVEPRTLVVPGQRIAVQISGLNKISAVAAADIPS